MLETIVHPRNSHALQKPKRFWVVWFALETPLGKLKSETRLESFTSIGEGVEYGVKMGLSSKYPPPMFGWGITDDKGNPIGGAGNN